MTQWRYFVSTDPGASPEVADRGQGGILRLPAGGSESQAEAVVRPGEWIPTSMMYRELYLGSGDHEFHEITPDRAQTLLRRFVELGRLDHLPDEASSITPEQTQALTERDHESTARWRNVEKPPGAEDVRF
jgi:hypothetical protein